MKPIVKAIISLIFYPMLWLRGLFQRIGNFLSGFFLLGLILGLFLHAPIGFLIGCGVFSFGFFLLTHFYDQILLKLNPTGNVLILG